jgi:hypothetical protein
MRLGMPPIALILMLLTASMAAAIPLIMLRFLPDVQSDDGALATIKAILHKNTRFWN